MTLVPEPVHNGTAYYTCTYACPVEAKCINIMYQILWTFYFSSFNSQNLFMKTTLKFSFNQSYKPTETSPSHDSVVKSLSVEVL